MDGPAVSDQLHEYSTAFGPTRIALAQIEGSASVDWGPHVGYVVVAEAGARERFEKVVEAASVEVAALRRFADEQAERRRLAHLTRRTRSTS